MAAHRQGTVIQSDTFDSTTPYTSSLWGSYITRMKLYPDATTYPQGCNLATTDPDRWETDGSLLLPSPNRTGAHANARFSEYRGIRTNFDPKANLGGIIGPTASNPVWYGVTARIKAPDTLPTVAGQLVETGVTIVGGNAADDQTALQLSWEYDATSGVEQLVLYRSTFCSTGHRTDRAPLVTMNDLSATSRNIGAGGYGIMTLEVYANSTTQFQVRVYWDESGVGASTTNSVGPFLTHIESLNLFALEGYCGVFMRQDGPISVGSVTTNPAFSNANLTARTGIDWWQVEDLRDISADPMFPIPEPAAAVSLASVVLAGEANASGSGLSVEPDFVLPLSYSIESRDFRTSDGTLISSPATSSTRRTWEMHWDGLNVTQRNTLDALWHASESGVFTFTWSHPQTSEALVLRPIGELIVTETAKNVYGARATVQEVL